MADRTSLRVAMDEYMAELDRRWEQRHRDATLRGRLRLWFRARKLASSDAQARPDQAQKGRP
jgi:hypothetical protein